MTDLIMFMYRSIPVWLLAVLVVGSITIIGTALYTLYALRQG